MTKKVKEMMNKQIKQKILDALEDDGKMKEYIVSFGDVFIEAKNEEEAEKEALKLIKNGEIEINFIEEN